MRKAALIVLALILGAVCSGPSAKAQETSAEARDHVICGKEFMTFRAAPILPDFMTITLRKSEVIELVFDPGRKFTPELFYKWIGGKTRTYYLASATVFQRVIKCLD